MHKEEKVYRELQRHLDKQAVAFPPSKSGAEIRILKQLFSKDEARLALHLSYKPHSAKQIFETAKAIGISFNDMENMLDIMMKNGSISVIERDGLRYYCTLPLVVGMFERHSHKLTPELVYDVEKYTSDKMVGLAYLDTVMPQMRTIPVEKSIPLNHDVTTYDHLTNVMNETNGPFVIFQCMCRRIATMKGNPCQKTTRMETCLALNDWAKNYVKYGMGREISKAEALEITRQNQADGLVIEPTNTQRIEAACACCGCCCGQLGALKLLPKPVDIWTTNYYAIVDDEDCSGCGDCVTRCQVNALSINASLGIASINPDRCIGCGVCVASCSLEAIRLHKKDKEIVPPMDLESLYDGIRAKRRGV